MKQALCLLCAAALLFGLCACSTGETAAVPTPAAPAETHASPTETPDPPMATPAETPEEPADPSAAPETGGQDGAPRVLVAYFSATGNTRALAEYAADALDCGLYEIVPAQPYTAEDLDYGNDSCRANLEQNDDSARPAIAGSAENLAQYDIIFLGYPIWWGQAPRILSTFLESYDFSGKTIVPFCTSGSSGIGSSAQNLHSLTPASTVWLEGARLSSSLSRAGMVEWINGLGLGLTAE